MSWFVGDDIVVIKTPGFPESISEGDIRWNKGKYYWWYDVSIVLTWYIAETILCICYFSSHMNYHGYYKAQTNNINYTL